MPFSRKVKAGICENEARTQKEKQARLFGLLVTSLCQENREFVFLKTESEEAVKHGFELIEELQGCAVRPNRVKRATKIFVQLKLKDLPQLAWQEEEALGLAESYCQNKNLKRFFIQGLFLGCGRVSDPLKEYRAEFVFKNPKLAQVVYEALSGLFLGVKTTTRSQNTVIYARGSETIEEMLTYMGAVKACFELMNTKIYKELRNNVNRATNCDSANIDKTILAAEAQVEKIKQLKNSGKFENLPQKLKKIAELRLENPQASNSELAQLLCTTRATVSYYLKKLTTLK